MTVSTPPSLRIPPAKVDKLPDTALPERVNVPALKIPPPKLTPPGLPFEIVKPERAATTVLETMLKMRKLPAVR
jgi:hypothetical protein